MSRHISSSKRGYQHAQEEEEEMTDDLEIAAAFAMAQYLPPPISTSTTTSVAVAVDDNEIDVDDINEDDEEDSEDPIDNVDMETNEESRRSNPKEEGKPDEDDKDEAESDAESDIDLTEALEKMDKNADLDYDIDEKDDPDSDSESDMEAKVALAMAENAHEAGASADTAPPQTIHEVDGYRGSVKQVEEIIGTSLHVDAALYTPQHTHPAGQIQHFMAEERIMVVRSLGNSPLLLEEGNLLVLKEPSWIPLGKILEVFGPVSQPLYSIRLPEPIESMDGETKQDEPETPNDPWSPNGQYTQWIKKHPDVMVHYLPQQANLVDTHMLLAQRQRGCDASNMWDEEIQHTAEMDYSDDEHERAARSRRSGAGRRGKQTKTVVPAAAVAATAPRPVGFYAPPAPSTATAYTAMPQQPTSFVQPQPAQLEESDTIYYD